MRENNLQSEKDVIDECDRQCYQHPEYDPAEKSCKNIRCPAAMRKKEDLIRSMSLESSMVLGLLRSAENGRMNVVLLREHERDYSLWKRRLSSFDNR